MLQMNIIAEVKFSEFLYIMDIMINGMHIIVVVANKGKILLLTEYCWFNKRTYIIEINIKMNAVIVIFQDCLIAPSHLNSVIVFINFFIVLLSLM